MVYNGAAYRTLDDAQPEGLDGGDPNRGCQADSDGWGSTNFLPVPPGYVLAPNDADTLAVIAAHSWSTHCAVLADGTAWWATNQLSGYPAGSDCYNDQGPFLVNEGGTYTVAWCTMRVLARCP